MTRAMLCLLAACSSPPGDTGDDGHGGTDAAGGSDSTPHADAAPGVQVDTEGCTHTASYGGTTANYAEHTYPGKTVADLAGLVARGQIHAGNGYTLPGYTHELAMPFVDDGIAAVVCGYTNVQYFDSVDFILRP
jgi:hypothetical protein